MPTTLKPPAVRDRSSGIGILAALELDVDPADPVAVSVAVADAVCNLNPLSSGAVAVGHALAVQLDDLVASPSTVDLHETADRIVRAAVTAAPSPFCAVVGFGLRDPGHGRRRDALADRIRGGVVRTLMALEDAGHVLRTPPERDLGI